MTFYCEMYAIKKLCIILSYHNIIKFPYEYIMRVIRSSLKFSKIIVKFESKPKVNIEDIYRKDTLNERISAQHE